MCISGGCLALAELSRRGLLLPDRLEVVVPLIREAVHYDILRGHHSVGSHVRDAACYVCWAFARAYSPDIMKPYISELTSVMLLTALFDREVNCRRAASAAFQENVGRQGNSNFKFGIEISTFADYFSLGNRFSSYTKVAISVASLDSVYLHNFFRFLRTSKIFHWDEEIRSLATQSMSQLVSLNAQNGIDAIIDLVPLCYSSNFNQRHGALLGVATLVLSVSRYSVLSDEIVAKVADIIPSLDKARLFRGRGGELLRKTSCLLVENIAQSNLGLNMKQQVSLVEFVNENLRQPFEGIQLAAAKALRCFLHSYFPVKVEPSQRLQGLTSLKYVEGLRTDQNAAATRGYALALGALPAKLILSPLTRFSEILEALAEACCKNRLICGEPDIETRRNALDAIVEIVEKLRPFIGGVIQHSIYPWIFNILFTACEDYTIDKRGDTGSWCRKVALMGIERIIYSASLSMPTYYCISRETLSTLMLRTNIKVYSCYGVGVIDSFEHNNQFVKLRFSDQSLGSRVNKDKGEEEVYHISTLYSLNSEHSESDITTKVIDIHLQSVQISHLYFSSDREINLDSAICVYSFDEKILTRAFSLIIQQLAEKLDVIRECAGEVFERLISSTGIYEISVKDISILQSTLSNRPKDIPFLWSNPVHVFPVLVTIFSSDTYFHPLLLGWVVSMGGLTEALVKESSFAFIKYFRSIASVSNTEFSDKCFSALLLIHNDNKMNDRVAIPLLKSLEIILRSGCVSVYLPNNATAVHDLIECIKFQISGSNDFVKTRVAIDVLCLIFDSSQYEHQETIIKQLVVLTGHKFPRIRKYSAEQLYVFIISGKIDCVLMKRESIGLQSLEEAKDQIIDVLLSTVWDGSTSEARSKRSFIYSHFGWTVAIGAKTLKEQEAGRASVTARHQKVVVDELDSYENLVREAGY